MALIPAWASRWRRRLELALFLGAAVGVAVAGAQEPGAPQAIAEAQLLQAIGHLGDLDYASRTAASRTVRRTAGAQAVPALLQAVREHADGYVRYRSLVLLTGFNDPRTREAMIESLSSPNDRLRTVGYSFFERNPERQLAPRLLAALDVEHAEFVRPMLVRALAALSDQPAVKPVIIREATRGEDFFRSTVIEALGDHKVVESLDTLVAIARLDGPLVDDAALAIGKLGDRRGLTTLTALRQSAPKVTQPFIVSAICLIGVDCENAEQFLVETLRLAERTPGSQESLRGAASGLAALAVAGRQSSAQALFEIGMPSQDPTRAPVALALATIALRNTPLMLEMLGRAAMRMEALALLAEGFDMLEEDLDKERFFALVRRTYWESTDNVSRRDLMQTLIGDLDF